MILLKKPIGAICIAPAMMAKILAEQNQSATMTIGKDKTTAKDIEDMGSSHKECLVEEIVIDEVNNIVTTPAYMDAKNISEAAAGIEKLVKQIILMVK